MRQFISAAGLIVLLAACGTKGPLVMPTPATKATAPAPKAPASTQPADDSNKAKTGAPQ